MDLLEHGKAEPGDPSGQGAPKSRRSAGVVATVVAVSLLGIGGVAYAAGNPGTAAQPSAAQATPTASPSPTASPDRDKAREQRGNRGLGPKLHGALGFGGRALHGEFTVKKREGGYQTVAVQNGTVTAVSPTSITVKSEDGYTRAYTVNASTIVRATREGISAVKTGHDVHVTATVSGSSATATHIGDRTVVRRR